MYRPYLKRWLFEDFEKRIGRLPFDKPFSGFMLGPSHDRRDRRDPRGRAVHPHNKFGIIPSAFKLSSELKVLSGKDLQPYQGDRTPNLDILAKYNQAVAKEKATRYHVSTPVQPPPFQSEVRPTVQRLVEITIHINVPVKPPAAAAAAATPPMKPKRFKSPKAAGLIEKYRNSSLGLKHSNMYQEQYSLFKMRLDWVIDDFTLRRNYRLLVKCKSRFQDTDTNKKFSTSAIIATNTAKERRAAKKDKEAAFLNAVSRDKTLVFSRKLRVLATTRAKKEESMHTKFEVLTTVLKHSDSRVVRKIMSMKCFSTNNSGGPDNKDQELENLKTMLKDKSIGFNEKMKILFSQYGMALVGVWLVTSIFWFSIIYTMVSR